MRRLLLLIVSTGLIAAEPLSVEVSPVQQGAASPFAAVMQLRAAQDALEAGHWDRAAAGFRSVLAIDAGLEEAQLGLVEAEMGSGRWLAADAALGTRHDPVRRTLIDFRLDRLGDPDTGLQAAFAMTHDPRLANALGEYRDDQGRGDAARQAFTWATPHQRAGVTPNNLGLSYLREGDLDRAQAAFDEAVALDPDDPLFARNRRLCALMRGDFVAGLEGVRGETASPLLREAGASALRRGETRLAELLLDRAERLSVRHDPRIAALRDALEDQRRDPGEDREG